MRTKFIAVLASTALILPVMASGAQAASLENRDRVTLGRIADGKDKVGGPAPKWFRNPNFHPGEPMPAPSATSIFKTSTGTVSPMEVFVAMPFCRDVYGHYYWMSASDNPASCTQGYVKYYDSRNSSYLGAIDVYMLYWKMTPSTALSTAYGWCTANVVCLALLSSLITSRISAAWTLIRSIRWAL